MILFILSFFRYAKFLIELNVIEIEIRMFYKINKSMVIEFPNITKITLSHTVLSWDGLLYFSFLSTKILKSISPEREIKGRNKGLENMGNG